uniref:CCHC-type domain-containing protein n=1 Tax=Lutzomyia longipalpis TaxID=7200 RepID=A0A1B0CNX3_LUTLO
MSSQDEADEYQEAQERTRQRPTSTRTRDAAPILPTNLKEFPGQKGKWRRWMCKTNAAFSIHGITDENTKKQWILFYLNLDSFDQLCNIITPREPDDLSYSELIRIMEDYYDPQPLEIVENMNFRRRIQKAGESIDDYMAALRSLTKYCNVGCDKCDNLNKTIRNQFVFGLMDKDIQKRLLEKKDLSLERALEIAKSMESSDKGKEEMTQKTPKEETLSVEANEVNKVQQASSKEGKRDLRCYRCGASNHLAKACLHANTTCNNCGKNGHLQRVCRQKKDEKGAAKVQRVNELEEIMQIEEIVEPKVFIDVRFCEDDHVLGNVKFEVDSGSGISIAGLKYKDEFFPKEKIIPTKKQFLHYGGGKLAVVGFIRVSPVVGDRVLRNVNLYFTEDRLRPPLFGREWIKRAKWVDWNKVLLEVNQTEEHVSRVEKGELVEELKREFRNVFQNTTGKIEGIQAELKLQDNASPVFLRHRDIPLSKRKAVEEEIERLVGDGVLVKVNQSREKCEKAFLKMQKEMQSEEFLAHYDPKTELVLAVDASPVGVGAVLSHRYPDGTERPIQYASQTLSKTQKGYAQFHQYVYGRHFTLITDNQALTKIFSPEKGIPAYTAMRMQHYAIFLKAFDYDIEFRKSTANANADGLSRLPIMGGLRYEMDEPEAVQIHLLETIPITAEQIRIETERTQEVKKLMQGLREGKVVPRGLLD